MDIKFENVIMTLDVNGQMIAKIVDNEMVRPF